MVIVIEAGASSHTGGIIVKRTWGRIQTIVLVGCLCLVIYGLEITCAVAAPPVKKDPNTWVLWEITFDRVRGVEVKLSAANPISAWTTKDDCEAALQKRMKDGGFRIVQYGLVEDEKGNLFDFNCLPETMDPVVTLH